MKRTTLHEHIDAVLYLAGTAGYTTVHFTDQKPRLYAYPLIRFVAIMPTLIRTHRTYLVNPHHVAAFHHQGVLEAFVLIGETKLPVSRRRAKAVYSALHSFSTLAVKQIQDRVVTPSLSSNQLLLAEDTSLATRSGRLQPLTNHRLVNIFDYEDASGS
jgi:hypothetical protein